MRAANTSAIACALLVGVTVLQSCVGAGDMFAEKRQVIGVYFLMTDEGDEHSYYLFRKGQSGSITGPLKAIGWNQHFILVEDDGTPGHWAAFPIDPQHDPLANAAARGSKILPDLRRTIVLRSPREVWEHSRELGSWITRPFS